MLLSKKYVLFVYHGSRDVTVKVATANRDKFLDAMRDTEEAKITKTKAAEKLICN
jgi:hypothetical protein